MAGVGAPWPTMGELVGEGREGEGEGERGRLFSSVLLFSEEEEKAEREKKKKKEKRKNMEHFPNLKIFGEKMKDNL
jgi:hypothetical protein